MFHSIQHSKRHQEMLNLLSLLRQGKLQVRPPPPPLIKAQEKELGPNMTYNISFFMNRKFNEEDHLRKITFNLNNSYSTILSEVHDS